MFGVALAVLTGIVLLVGATSPAAVVTAELPEPARGALVVTERSAPASEPAETRWAPVLRGGYARSAPDRNGAVVHRVPRTTPKGTTNIVRVLDRRRDSSGRLWIKIPLADVPNGRTGWVPRSTLGGYTTVTTRIVVDLDSQTLTLTDREVRTFTARIGVGTSESPTPTGELYVRNVLRDFDSPFYGPITFGTNARSPVRTDWPGSGFIGIHGTDRPGLIPGRISNGCIRLRNADVLALARILPVGTPVVIRGGGQSA
jgi:lipoprotein-anchoring transpeptidase ErfK/SrfK